MNYVQTIEVLFRYKVFSTSAKWFINAYNWNTENFSGTGFNNTNGNETVANKWNEYAINITGNWVNYIAANSTIVLQFSDDDTSTTQTTVEGDFVGVRTIINGTNLEAKKH